MEFKKVLALRGPNVWARFSVLEAWVDLGEYANQTSSSLAGFNDRLLSWLPTLADHRCCLGEAGGFFDHLHRDMPLAEVLEHVTLELQTLAGTAVSFGRIRDTRTPGVFKIAVEFEEEALAKACLETARNLVLAAILGQPFEVRGELARLRELAQDICLGPSTRSIVEAATRRGIPFRRLNTGSMVQFGHGTHQRRIIAAESDNTSAIAESIAQDKDLTRDLLQTIGVPVPVGRPVENADDAWEAACDIGLPVVVKPQYGNHGRGVATNLSTREQVVAAFAAAKEEGSSIMVEKFAPGSDHRLLVIDGKLVAAARREPAHVLGDGRLNILELIDRVNADPRRGEDHGKSLTKIKLDPVALQVLEDQGCTPLSVPAAGRKVLIRRNGNLSTGGTACDVTDSVHPSVAQHAIDAVRVIGLDIAGVDIVCTDITQPLEEQGGIIVEVNAGPGLRMHIEPSDGQPRPVGDAIIDSMFPEGQTGRVPIVTVTGTNGKTTTTRFITHILKRAGRRVGMCCTDGIYIDGQRIDKGDCSGPGSAKAILMNPKVEAAVLETARGGILRAGLGFDRCDVAVVTNIAEGDHLGIGEIDTPEEMAVVKRCTVEAVSRDGSAVLNAADPLVAAMADHCLGKTVMFALDANNGVLRQHVSTGGRAVFVRQGEIILAEGDRETMLLPLVRVPLTHNGMVGFQVENTLASVAAAWSLGVGLETIRGALETFSNNLNTCPGRFNLLEIGGQTVIIDYGHNPSALLAIIEAIEPFPHAKRLCVYSAAGDRRDCDFVRQGKLLGDAFDRVILYEDHYLRGRAEGEIMRLFQQGLADGGRVAEIHEVRGAIKSVQAALSLAQPGELLVIQADEIDETVDYVRTFLESGGCLAEHPAATEARQAAAESRKILVNTLRAGNVPVGAAL
ncbi:MAG: cyanophycin synthetase [Pirellulales bacterium]